MTAASAAPTALCGRFGLTETAAGLSRCWCALSAKVLYVRRTCFSSAADTWLDSAIRAVVTVLVVVIGIAVGDADGGAEGIIY